MLPLKVNCFGIAGFLIKGGSLNAGICITKVRVKSGKKRCLPYTKGIKNKELATQG